MCLWKTFWRDFTIIKCFPMGTFSVSFQKTKNTLNAFAFWQNTVAIIKKNNQNFMIKVLWSELILHLPWLIYDIFHCLNIKIDKNIIEPRYLEFKYRSPFHYFDLKSYSLGWLTYFLNIRLHVSLSQFTPTPDDNANFKLKVSHQFTCRQLSNITGEIFLPGI